MTIFCSYETIIKNIRNIEIMIINLLGEKMKTLYRSRNHKVIAGVAGGIGDYFEIDPVFIRVLFIITLFTGGVGIIAYIVLWIIAPKEPFEFNYNKQFENNKSSKPDSDIGTGSINEQNPDSSNVAENFGTHSFSSKLENLENKNKVRIFGGILLIVLGLILLMDNIIPEFDFTYVWSIILILIGSYIIFANPKMSKTNE